MSRNRRYHPPSEDFAECKQKLKDANTVIEQLTNTTKRLRHTIDDLNELVADILDDKDI